MLDPRDALQPRLSPGRLWVAGEWIALEGRYDELHGRIVPFSPLGVVGDMSGQIRAV
jgi:hypothetical protein